MEEEANAAAGKTEPNPEDQADNAAAANEPIAVSKQPLVGFQRIISEENLLSKMWLRVNVDFDNFRDRYEDWLEEEVWTYFD